MRYILFPFLLTFLLAQTAPAQTTATAKRVLALVGEKDFFRARQLYQLQRTQLKPAERLVIEGHLYHAFNQPALSNRAIAAFLEKYPSGAADTLKMELKKLKMLNHVRLFEYGAASRESSDLVTRYGSLLAAADLADYKNTAVIWQALTGQPAQAVTVHASTTVKMKRDKAKLANLEVRAPGTSSDFIFDTGANLSTVTETTAKAFGMRMLQGSIEVGAITGGKVNSRLAVCPVFSIGQITVKNAVFLVFPDSALAFPQIQYQINGILGFPVIEGLKEVQLTQTDDFIVPKMRTAKQLQNMALDFLTPVIDLNGEHYTFDTGATGSMLYGRYLDKHKAEIEKAYTETDLRFGGAGGMQTRRGYKITFYPVVNGKKIALTDVQVLREAPDRSKASFYGNIGQDLIRKFNKMTLNFEHMFIRFDQGK